MYENVPFVFLGFFDFLNPFAGIMEDLSLLMLAFKIVILLFILQFVRNRFGSGTIVTILVLALGYVMLFTDYFFIFGPMMFIYLFIAFGFFSILFDLSIAKPWTWGKTEKMMAEQESGGHAGGYHEYHEQQEKAQQMRRGGIY